MLPFVRVPNGRKNPRAAAIAVIVAIGAAVNALITATRPHRGVSPKGGGDIGSTTTILAFAGVVLVPVVVFLIMKMVRNGDDETSKGEDMSNNENTSSEERDENRPLRLILVVIAALVGFAVAFFAYSEKAQAQGAAERGAFVAKMGNDTLIVDKFERTADTLRGAISMKGQPRQEYVLALGSGNSVHTLQVYVRALGSPPGAAPLQQAFVTMQGDSAIVQTGTASLTKTVRLGTNAGATPAMANAFAIGELLTRRASATGRNGDYPYLALSGGLTIAATVRPLGTDSVLFTLATAKQHYRVDAAGRILGGTIEGQPIVITRATAQEAAKITFGTVKPDYSAPAGAPYAATEVSIKGPSGVLGGTLTIPSNTRPPFPAVVTITGSGLQDRDEYVPFAGGIRLFRELADTLSRRGIAVLRLDDRSIGSSGGDAKNATSADFADDIRAGIGFLRTRTDIDAGRIAVAGHSEGGMIGPMVAATDPKLRAVVVLAGPSWKGLDIVMEQNKYSVEHAPNLTKTQRDSIMRFAHDSLLRVTTPWLKYFMAYDPGPTAMKVKQPVLILQGATDAQVYPQQADSLAKLIRSGGNRDVTVRVFPATNHLFVPDSSGNPAGYGALKSNKIRPEVLGAVADWLVLKMGAPPVVK